MKSFLSLILLSIIWLASANHNKVRLVRASIDTKSAPSVREQRDDDWRQYTAAVNDLLPIVEEIKKLHGSTDDQFDFLSLKRSSTVRVGDNEWTLPAFDRTPKVVMMHLTRQLCIEQRKQLERELNVTLRRYIPDWTYVVAADALISVRAMLHDWVDWVGPYLPEYKFSAELGELESLDATSVDEATTREYMLTRRFELLLELERSLVRTARDAAELADHLQNELRAIGGALTDVNVTVSHVDGVAAGSAADRLSLYVDADEKASLTELQAILRALVQYDEVYLVERRQRHGFKNKYATWITQSGIKGEQKLWQEGIRGQNQVVGAADSGLDADNCFFNDPTQNRPSASNQVNQQHRKILAYYSVSGADYVDDPNGHGTHVCGSIVGSAYYPRNAGDQQVVDDWNGNAPDAKIVFHDIGFSATDPHESGLSVDSNNMDRDILKPAFELGARVHSNSWGCSGSVKTCNAYSGGARAVDVFTHENPSMLVLFAAGNDGQSAEANTQTVGAPATSKNALVIGAAQTTHESFVESIQYYDWNERIEDARAQLGEPSLDCCRSSNYKVQRYCCEAKVTQEIRDDPDHHNIENVAEFSSRGPTYDGRIKPDMLAPGQNIVSAHGNGFVQSKSDGQCGLGQPAGKNDAALLSMQGTSMATPIAAGAAVLVRQYFKEGFYPSGVRNSADAFDPSGALVKAIMLVSGVELQGQIDLNNDGMSWQKIDPIYPATGIFQGFGRLQLATALRFSDSTHRLYVDDTSSVSQGESVTYCFDVDDSRPIKVLLTWYDPPGEGNSAVALINNLDLVAGTGESDRKCGGFETLSDARNNAEIVIEKLPTVGSTYRVRVNGTDVAQGPQRYALAVTGWFRNERKGCDFQVTACVAASEEDYYPYGNVVGGLVAGVAGLTFLSVIGYIVKAYLQNGQLPGMSA